MWQLCFFCDRYNLVQRFSIDFQSFKQKHQCFLQVEQCNHDCKSGAEDFCFVNSASWEDVEMPSPEFQAPPKLGPFQWIEGKFEHFWLTFDSILYITILCTVYPIFSLLRKLTSTTERLNKQIVRAQEEPWAWCEDIASTTAATFSSSKSDCSSGSDIRSLFLKLWRCLVFVETKLDLLVTTLQQEVLDRIATQQDSDHLRTDLFKMQTSLDMGVKKNKACHRDKCPQTEVMRGWHMRLMLTSSFVPWTSHLLYPWRWNIPSRHFSRCVFKTWLTTSERKCFCPGVPGFWDQKTWVARWKWVSELSIPGVSTPFFVVWQRRRKYQHCIMWQLVGSLLQVALLSLYHPDWCPFNMAG